MSRPLRPLRLLCSVLLGLSAALGVGACAGTPLPEPPDSVPLPRPELAAGDATVTAVAGSESARPAVFTVSVLGVPPDAQLVVLNLDALPTRLSAPTAVDGGDRLNVGVLAAPGDRLRVLFTSDRGHSPPLDLVAGVPVPDDALALPATPLEDTSLPCLQVAPRESLVLAGRRGQLGISNTCDVSVQLTRAVLHNGAQGISLAAPPVSQLAAGARTTLILEDAQGPGPRERLDVLLLDVRAADGRSGRYAIDVFSALQ